MKTPTPKKTRWDWRKAHCLACGKRAFSFESRRLAGSALHFRCETPLTKTLKGGTS